MTTTPEQAQRLRLIKSLELFEQLPDALLEQLAQHCIIHRLERGDVLWREGSEAHSFTFIIQGHVKISRLLMDGREVILGVFTDGSPIGQIAVYQRAPYPAQAEALGDVIALRLPRAQFIHALRQDAALLEGVLFGMMERNRHLSQRVADLATASAEQRLALLFHAFAQSSGRRMRHQDGHMGTFVAIPLTRQDIASLINTRIETAIRIMSRWGKDGIVITQSDGFWIPSVEQLCALAQGHDHD